jgi:SAM-dependent methyltransferase
VARPAPGDAGPPEFDYPGRDLEAMAFAPRYHAWIRDEFAPVLHGDVAEVGAGDGGFSHLLLALPLRSLTLYEPCAALQARQPPTLGRPDVTRKPTTLGADAPQSAFDAVLYVNVLEHIADDVRELALAHAALRPGGRLCVFVPALRWLTSAHDRRVGHQRRYGRAELRQKVEAAGFTIERLDWFDAPGVLGWALCMKLLGLTMQPATVALYDRAVVSWLRPLEQRWRPPVGKNLLLVARRSEAPAG